MVMRIVMEILNDPSGLRGLAVAPAAVIGSRSVTSGGFSPKVNSASTFHRRHLVFIHEM